MHKIFYIKQEIKKEDADKQKRKEVVRNWLKEQGITPEIVSKIRSKEG